MILKNEQVKLLDLGFAKKIQSQQERVQEDTTCGTPEYMSPEQAMGYSDLDIRSDIYSLGATLYHMVFGETPFKGTTSLEIMAKQVLQELSSVKTKKGSISPLMQYFIEKMMAKDTQIRYQSPTEVKNDILENLPKLRVYLDNIVQPKKTVVSDKFSTLKKDKLKDLLK
jgi:serine/threonine-protein kinase